MSSSNRTRTPSVGQFGPHEQLPWCPGGFYGSLAAEPLEIIRRVPPPPPRTPSRRREPSRPAHAASASAKSSINTKNNTFLRFLAVGTSPGIHLEQAYFHSRPTRLTNRLPPGALGGEPLSKSEIPQPNWSRHGLRLLRCSVSLTAIQSPAAFGHRTNFAPIQLNWLSGSSFAAHEHARRCLTH
jgi:hypothetical protein